jgi:hypothetical protein
MINEEMRSGVIKSLLHFAGRENQEVNGKTRPIPDLGLDSEDGVAWSVELEKLGIRVPLDLNPLVDDTRHRARSVDEIMDLIMDLVAQ